ncbi:hypothetical protein [Rhodanobacter denitrificans]|uniref:Uncharacterized protein n=1 Tax=Rhodanobacter denitrificans TaxID=666685 RepID=M4NGN7_9GAMM|nr:hypothetical protein [Rhodanobacter denitrificans]AGG90110.1 hypothetical protein R2APBS1_3036 [Rhodanobacter denitrificans]UJM85498.1 hypothetical protein LRJ86_12005 [Rhodanobacter denitrificans]
MGFFILLIVVVVLIVVVKKGMSGGGASMSAPPGFNPTFQLKNLIAIDMSQNILMTKDGVSGRVVYTKKANILRWNKFDNNGHFGVQIHVHDLDHPMILVSFGRNSRGAHLAREEWSSRLSTWVNNS